MKRSTFRMRYGCLFLLMLFGCLLAGSASAQLTNALNETTNVGLGGTNFIVGTVFLPDGQPINRRTRIRISSRDKEIVASTDDVGRFVFAGFVNGLYTLTIEGEKEFESVIQQVEVNTGRDSQVYTLQIRLIYRPNGLAKPAVINSAMAGVPKKAVELYDKAVAL